MKSQSLVVSFASCVVAATLWATPASADIMAEYTTAGATVNTSLFGFAGSDPFNPNNNEIAVSGTHLFVANTDAGTIGEYTTAGAVVNAGLISDHNGPYAIAVSGSDLFVLNENGTIGEYTTGGATVNASLVTGLPTELANSITVSGSDLFVSLFNFSNPDQTKVAEYTTGGTLVNASLITGLAGTLGITASGSDLFVANDWNDTIGEYTTSGSVVNASLVKGLNAAFAITASGGDLFVIQGPMIGEYTTAGATVNASLITTGPSLWADGIAVSGSDVYTSLYVLPEPSTFVMLAIGGAALAVCGWRRDGSALPRWRHKR